MIFAKPCQDAGLKMSNGPIISRMAGNRLKTHGLKGEVKVYLTTTEVEKRFKRGSVLYILLDDSSYKKVTVNTFKYIEGNLAFVTFKEFKDINEIEHYLKKEVENHF